MSPRHIFVAAVAITAIAFGTWLSFKVASPPPVTQVATVLPVAGELPNFSLLDHNGDPVGRDVFKGHWNLVFFGFTHCPDICPLTMKVLSSARNQLAEDGIAPLPRVVLVSVDPERDTPENLAQYIAYFGEGNLGITGDLPELLKLTNGLGIFFEKSAGDGENYSVDHSAVVLVINPDGRFKALFGAPHETDNFIHDLPLIMSQK